MILILDTETTGREPPEVIELAHMEVEEGTWRPHPYEEYCERFKPNEGSAYGALATHHILDEELVDSRAFLPSDVPLATGLDPTYWIGHNIDYDWKALGSPPVRRICTLAIARKILPDLDSHSLSALVYHFEPNKFRARELVRHAHGAAHDVMLCHSILLNLLDVAGLSFPDAESLWSWSEACRIPDRWSFGKFRGQPIRAADRGYLQWCLKQPDMDEYVKKAVREVLR